MTIVRYEPFRLLNRFHRDLARFFDFDDDAAPVAAAENAVTWLPSVDVREEDNRYVLHADLPGVDKKDIEITAEKGVLTLRGERRTEAHKSTRGYERVERVTGRFIRRFALPESADVSAITAKHDNGVLEVSIPKVAAVQPKRIEIQAA
jgi:HSP20 family protein